MYSTAVGYAGGTTEHPTYQETCGGSTGHAEVVQVVYDPQVISTEAILSEFWSGHQPTVEGAAIRDGESGDDPSANRDGRTDQYRSIILASTDEQLKSALEHRDALDDQMSGNRRIGTQITRLADFYYAEDYHQQWSAKRVERSSCPS